MDFVRAGTVAFALIGALLLNTACADTGAQKQALPRSFGSLTLGMTEEVLKKLTGLSTYACHHCAQYEYTVAVYAEKYPSMFPAYIYALPKHQRGFDCYFYKGKLYKIETSPEISEINAAKKIYTERFGPISGQEDWPNGVSWVTWENKTTAFVLAYDREKSGTFWHPIPAGTVTLVRYIDKPLRDALEAQEKKNPTRAHH